MSRETNRLLKAEARLVDGKIEDNEVIFMIP